MKKRHPGRFNTGSLLIAAVIFLAINFNIEAGGKTQKQNAILTIGATIVPHAVLLNLVKDDMAARGITLNVVEFADYMQPNIALINGDLDANFSQHLMYLEENNEWSQKLVSVFEVHIEPFGLYSARYKNINDLPNGSTIAIPNDPTNCGRALLLLEANGLITLREGAGITATPRDITSNPKSFRFRELEVALLPRALEDVAAATINGNFALQAGFNPLSDSLIIEGAESPYVNIVAVRRGSEKDSKILALRDVLLSSKVRDFIHRNYGGGVIPVF